MGVYFVKFRIGELGILFSFLVLVSSLFLYKRIDFLNKLLDRKIYYVNLSMIVSFFLLLLI